MKALKNSFRELLKYPSAVVGLTLILALVAVAVYAVIAIPYAEAVHLWRGGEDVWYLNPKNVPPAWTNLFRSKKLPVSFHVSTVDGEVAKVVTLGKSDTTTYDISYTFDFEADEYPQDLILYFTDKYTEKLPFASIILVRPDGSEVRVADTGLETKRTVRFSQEPKLVKKFGKTPIEVMQGLFSDPTGETSGPLKGDYQVLVIGTTFEAGADIDVQIVMHGLVSGLAGTDHNRRDLMIALLWGTPIALSFGLIASLGVSVLTMIISAFGTWFGGWVDDIIQRITEVNLVLPFLPILIMIGTFFDRSSWTLLGATIALSIFGGGIKTYRSIFLQVKESPYIEAARAYGASNTRVIFQYLIPRMIPLLIPGLVAGVPGFVFLEASLAVLGLGDPVLPTWGKVINDAWFHGALYQGYYYWIVEPAVLLMLAGLAFAMLGFALDRVFNPRLRGQ
jgi:peptide/nickel transport system permease protein